nr:3-oxoacyl-[acyl-carrier-protein] reductase FabG-like [Ipomoea batatas]GME15549.1 3-oxoacyl-[acyl-carrier-protein] reductase FabG-like [Ipomoea batatas]GME17927.1 3-oxoacyl-[acyl-carrier-protein] reductase FabG-like [Ipomoea batatas]
MAAGKRVVLVTGCAKGGIGYEYCKAFAEHDCHVFASDISQRMSDLSDLRSHSNNNNNIETLELDVTSDESVAGAVDTIMSKFGQIDVVVNNAGVGITGPLAEIPTDQFLKAYEVNTVGALRVAQHVVPHMAARRRGRIVNIGSVVGNVATPWAGPYCASKAAVHAMTDTLRLELRPFDIDVILVIPGSVRSNFGANASDKLRNFEWKMYKEFTEAITERATASQGGKATDPRVFARHVAGEVLSAKAPKRVEFGHMSGLFRLLSWCPVWGRDAFMSNRFKLNRKVFI